MKNSTIISKARAYCEQRGARFTPLREKVYELMLEKRGPMGAYELLDGLKETESSAKPATVYRALDFLLDFGLIHRLESTNAFVACYHFGCHHPVQFLICDSCGDVCLAKGSQRASAALYFRLLLDRSVSCVVWGDWLGQYRNCSDG